MNHGSILENINNNINPILSLNTITEIIYTHDITHIRGGGSYSDHSNSYTRHGQTRDIVSAKYKVYLYHRLK